MNWIYDWMSRRSLKNARRKECEKINKTIEQIRWKKFSLECNEKATVRLLAKKNHFSSLMKNKMSHVL